MPTLYNVLIFLYTVKPAHAVTSIKQSPVLKGHHFLVVIENLKFLPFRCPKCVLLIQV